MIQMATFFLIERILDFCNFWNILKNEFQNRDNS